MDTGPASIMKSEKQSKRFSELGSDVGARPLSLLFAKLFRMRNWSLDFFRHANFTFIGMPELTTFGSSFFDHAKKEFKMS